MNPKSKKIGFDVKSKDKTTKFDKGSDTDADKTGTDKNSDATQIVKSGKKAEDGKFDKPKREKNPDRTGIDTNSDKTKK
ncbi:MAG: hypothetical protein JNM51_11305 [Bacteroidia bacterium]|nr:hypothetical protein [Bacteroidia bacterium]